MLPSLGFIENLPYVSICYPEAIVFISEYSNGVYNFIERLTVPGRIGNLTGGLILADVNFDGEYNLNTSFSEIPNPAIDVQNQKVLSTWRNKTLFADLRV